MSKNLKILIPVLLALMVAAPAAMAATFEFHGDLDNRFKVYTDQQDWFGNDTGTQTLDDRDAPDTWGEIKYRLWTKASTNDGKVYGVYGIEIGGLRFGQSSNSAGDFSGDGIITETRWAYTDFQLPSVESKARFRIGLFTHKVNKFFWAETAMGVKFYGDNYYLAWMRGKDVEADGNDDWLDDDLDTISARYDLKMEPVKVGFFAAYMARDNQNTSANADGLVSQGNDFTGTGGTLDDYAINSLDSDIKFDLFTIGVDGSWSTATSFGKAFVNWDLLYETGSFDDSTTTSDATIRDLDLSAYFAHVDLGLNFGKSTVTYTLIYASGDDNPDDNDLDGWIGVDTDNFYTIIFGEGGYTNDDYVTERFYLGDKGMFLNKLAFDYKANKKLKLGIAGLYLLLAEDVTLANGAQEDALGFEIDAYVSYKLYPNLLLTWNIGYLASDDAMDIFESGPSADVGNGSGDVDILVSTARVRYGF